MSKKYSHINSRGTGCQLVVKPFPAWNSEEGSVKFTLHPQNGTIEFNEDDSLEFFCTPKDIARMLGVFRGMEETVNNGKGMRMLNTIMKFEHRIDPIPGYRLSIWEQNNGDMKHLEILLDTYEALELSLALEGVMSKLVFGM